MEFNPEASAGFNVTVHGRSFDVSLYQGGQPKVAGRSIACDTETTQFVEGEEYVTTDLVLSQFCDGTSIELVPWHLTSDYMKVLESTSPAHTLLFYNVGFDMNVLRKWDAKLWKTWLEPKFDKDQVVDVGLRYTLDYIAERGWVPKKDSLALLAERELGYKMNKDIKVRLTFTRDMLLTLDHAKYASLDAAVTWLLADKKGPQPTEGLQTRGSYALYNISKNGFLVDRPKFEEFRTKLTGELEHHGFDLRAFGYMPTKQKKKQKALWEETCVLLGLTSAAAPGSPTRVRHACARAAKAVLERAGSPDLDPILEELAEAFMAPGSCRKDMEEALPYLEALAGQVGAEGLEKNRKPTVLVNVAYILVKGICDWKGKTEILQDLSKAWDENAGWDDANRVGAGTFLQNRLAEIEKIHNISLPRTESMAISATKATLDNMARQGVTDPFFEKLRAYKHTEKLLGTYVNPKYIKADGRVHPRFTVMVRTGRTSCSSPNIFHKMGVLKSFELLGSLICQDATAWPATASAIA